VSSKSYIRIFSWNVNGIGAIAKKDFSNGLKASPPIYYVYMRLRQRKNNLMNH
jgi:exonuclease III